MIDLKQTVEIAGHRVPLALLGAGAGGVLALALFLLRGTGRRKPVVSAGEAEYNALAAVGSLREELTGELTARYGELSGRLSTGLSEMDASLQAARAQFGVDLLSQAAGLRGEFAGGLAGLQANVSGQIASLQDMVQAQSADTQAALQAQAASQQQLSQTVTGSLTALTQRVAAVERTQARTGAQTRNLIRAHNQLLSWMSNVIPEPGYSTLVNPWTTQVIVPSGPTSGNLPYESIPGV
jgi:hypothetical protein